MADLTTTSVQASLPRNFQRPIGTRSEFDAALLAVLSLKPIDGRDGLQDGRRARMVAALDNRASYSAIRHWRHNTRPAPQWARELLAAKLHAAAQSQIGRAERLRLALV